MKSKWGIACAGVLLVSLCACSKNPAGPAAPETAALKSQGFNEVYAYSRRLAGMTRPAAVAFNKDGYVYVTDSVDQKISKFTPGGTLMFSFGQDWLYTPMGIAVDDVNSLVFVADNFRNCIQVFDQQGRHVKAWTGFNSPQGVLAYGGSIYVCDTGNNVIKRYNPLAPSGSAPMLISALYSLYKKTPVTLNQPQSLVADTARGYLYVTDLNHRVLKFTPDDKQLIAGWGSQGGGNTQFNQPDGVAAVNHALGDRVFVVDRINSRVKVFNTGGGYVTAFGGYGTESTQFKFYDWMSRPYAAGMASDKSGNLYVADPGNGCVKIFIRLMLP